MSKISDIRKKIWVDRTPLELCITQSPRPQIRAKAAEDLASRSAAGEKMAERLRALRNFQEEAKMRGQSSITVEVDHIFNSEDAAALEAWEAANK